jgi:hypothetical protein
MSDRSDLTQRLGMSQNAYKELLDRHENILKSVIAYVMDLEKYEHIYCKDSLANELGLNTRLGTKSLIRTYKLISAEMRKISRNSAKSSLAFDSMRDIADSRKASES